MVIRLADGRETTIDYRETAPAAAHRDMFLDAAGNPVGERSLVGPLAAGVPGSVAGLALAQRRYGRLPLATVMAPAVRLARDGFEISWHLAASLASASGAVFPVPVDRSHVSAALTAPLPRPASAWCSPTSQPRSRRLPSTGRTRSTASGLPA